ncbi:MAG: hypothetical protein KKF56_05595 [Nanoarchaeota archaeon]|nr:hypothetical protein [Nanoarchaeota archaeon]
MKELKEKETIDFCEDCGKDVEEQKVNIIECDCGFYHNPCQRCRKLKKYLKKKQEINLQNEKQ